MKKFAIRLKEAHQKSGLSYYQVAKLTGVAKNTVVRYAPEEADVVVVAHLDPAVLTLAEFYGLDWRNPSVVDVVDEEIENPEKNTHSIARRERIPA